MGDKTKGERKIRVYLGWVIAQAGEEFLVYSRDEWEAGAGYREPEFNCGSVRECIENIDSYDTDDERDFEQDRAELLAEGR
jgi:hypothetical protein